MFGDIKQSSEKYSPVYSYKMYKSNDNKYPPVKYISLLRNHGTLYVRCLGISIASNFTMFMDSDDELVGDIVAKAYKKQQETNVDIVYFGTNKIENR